jgi:hypothetical protein
MTDNSGLVYKPNKNSSTIYVNIKGDGTLVKRLKGEEEEKYLKMKEDGLFWVDPKTQLSDEGIQIRALAMGQNKGDIVVEQVYTEMPNVKIVNCYKNQTENRFNLVLVVKNMDDSNAPNVHIVMPYFNGEKTEDFSGNFIDRSPNIDINMPIKINPYSFIDKEKDKQVRGISLYQEGKKIESAFTKDKGNKPMATSHKLGSSGKVHWNWEEVGKFQDEVLEKFIQKFNNQQEVVEAPQNKDEVEMPF